MEYAGNWSAFDDLINLQYSQHIVKMSVVDGIIDHGTNVNIPAMPDHFEEEGPGTAHLSGPGGRGGCGLRHLPHGVSW